MLFIVFFKKYVKEEISLSNEEISKEELFKN